MAYRPSHNHLFKTWIYTNSNSNYIFYAFFTHTLFYAITTLVCTYFFYLLFAQLKNVFIISEIREDLQYHQADSIHNGLNEVNAVAKVSFKAFPSSLLISQALFKFDIANHIEFIEQFPLSIAFVNTSNYWLHL